jgi:hypothetical protein
MLRRIRPQLTYANVMVTLLAFGARAGGTAYAANTILSADIVDGEVKTPDIATGAVVGAKLATNAVTSGRVADGSLRGADVLDDSLTGADIDESTLATGGGVGTPEAWHDVAAGSTTEDRCADARVTAVFCSARDSFDPKYYPWRNYGGAFSPVAFYKDQLGIIHLKGLAQAALQYGTVDLEERPIFRLPAGYRPQTRRVFTSVGTNIEDSAEVAIGRIDIIPNGLVTLVHACGIELGEQCSASGADVTLDGITFRTNG